MEVITNLQQNEKTPKRGYQEKNHKLEVLQIYSLALYYLFYKILYKHIYYLIYI
jgi:hypothetical protein